MQKPSFINEQNRSYQSLHLDINNSVSDEESLQNGIIFGFRSRQGVLISNPNKVNQDACICKPNLIKNPQIHFFGVCDGHGQNGHIVSNFIKQNLPNLLSSHPQILFDVKNALIKSIQILSNQINKTNFDTQFSGSTLNCVTIIDNIYLLCANIGDSRSIIGRYIQDGNQSYFQSIELSLDHKPSVKKERQRIIKSGGRVDSYYDNHGNPVGPQRVWVQNANFPGLAMSRSLGDQVAASVGVSYQPDIYKHTIQKSDKFLVIASDGVWEFISNIQCIELVGKFYLQNNLEGASNELMKLSYEKWTKEDDSVIDDISFIIVFFHQNQSINSTLEQF